MKGIGVGLNAIAAVGVMLAWTVLLVVILRLRVRGAGPRAKRDRLSVLGLALQGLGFALVWGFEQPPEGGLVVSGTVAVGLALFLPSIWLFGRSMRHLGKQWSLAARVRDDHRLVTDGPYRFVRHPIYTAMLGMLLATGLAFSAWKTLLPAVAVYLLGTAVRIRREEALLRGSFGEEFEAYARRVPALIPPWL